MNGYEATKKLAKEHPELLPKLKMILELGCIGVFSNEELTEAGITEDEISIFRDYGLLQKVNVTERSL